MADLVHVLDTTLGDVAEIAVYSKAELRWKVALHPFAGWNDEQYDEP